MPEIEFYKQPTLPGIAEPPTGELMPETIGPYKIESLLSKGGMSFLYLGLHPETHIPLAIKVLSPKFTSEPRAIQQFLKEAQIIALTDHPNIVKLYGQGKWEKGLYIAMEFIQGISLQQFIIQHSLSHRRALEILLSVAYALLHLHTHGVVHRDLKPENILIMENGQVKVIDFGIAQLALEDEKKAPPLKGGLIGTPSYMSPEQKKDPASTTYASDIFSLGVIGYELIVGKLSFGNIQLSYLPQGLRKIIGKALEPSLEKRYQDIVDFISDISSYLKSSEMQREKMGNDGVKEIWEGLSNTQQKMLSELPKWQDIDFGFAKPAGVNWPGLYYDFFKFPDRNLLFFIGEDPENLIESYVHVGILKGMVHMLVGQFQHQTFNPLLFISQLNDRIASDHLKMSFALNMLYLDIAHDSFSFISCGYGPIWHIPRESRSARLHISQNPLLGKTPHTTFAQDTDNWKEGDTLFFHSFLAQQYTPTQEQSVRDELMRHTQLSAQAQAESLYRHIQKVLKLEHPLMLSLCIQRII